MKEPDISKQSKAVTYPLRMSADLRDWLSKQAEKNQRSINGEIVYRLQSMKEGATA